VERNRSEGADPDAASRLLRRKTTEEAGRPARDSPYRFAWKSL